jgi:hypothetical protein
MSGLSFRHLSLIAHSPSQSPPQAPLNEDATMASEPTLSSLAQLAESALGNFILFAPSDSTSAAEIMHPHAAPEDVDDPISVGGCASLSLLPFAISSQDSHQFEEILARTQTERFMKIYDLPTFFLDARISGRARAAYRGLLKVRTSSSPPKLKKHHFFPVRWHPQHIPCGALYPHQLEPPKNTFLF